MSRPSGPLQTFLLLMTAGGASLLLGFGAMTVSSALGAPTDQDLGDAVVLDPATVTTPTPTPTHTPAPRKSGVVADPLVGGGSTAPSRAAAPAPAPAPAPHAPAPVATHVPEHWAEQVVPVPPSPADGEHHRG